MGANSILFTFQQHSSTRGSYRGYDSEELTRAYLAVKDNTMSIRRAAETYGVPKTTLIDRLHGRINVDVLKSGTPPLFSEEQEALLSGHLKTMAEVGYGYSRQETINLASDYAVCLGLRDKDHPLTNRWLYNFIQRWPELKLKKPRSLEIARAKCATREAVDNYFIELDKILVKNNLKNKPHLIYNVDEKSLQPEHKPPKIVSAKHYKAQAVTSGKSKMSTLIGCVNGAGQQVPPFFVFPGARMTDSLMEGATPGADGTVSESGWSNTQIFSEYMQNHLIKFLPQRSDDTPVLVLYDGHKSHVSLSLIEWAKSENVILFVFPPHCSHLLQPLDVSCFGPFENAWNSACHHYMRETGGKLVTRNDVCRLACKVYSSTITACNIQSAFKKSGLIPFNPNVISDPQVAPSTSFKRDSDQEMTSVNTPSLTHAENFLQKKGGESLQNVETAKKKRNTLSKIVGGKAITDDHIVNKIVEHSEKSVSKGKQSEQKRTKKNTEKSSSKGKQKQKKHKGPSGVDSQIPGPSGIPDIKLRKKINVTENEDYSDSEDEMPEKDKCIICKKSNPDWRKKPFVIILNWGQCDICAGWVHLSFCSPVRVLRRGDAFLCPLCQAKSLKN